MQFLQIVKLVLSILPLIIDSIKAIEAAIPGAGNGEQKLAIVRAAIEAAYNASGDVVGKFEEVWPVIKNLISSVVAIFNTVGVFKK